jgi:hypothetical protein
MIIMESPLAGEFVERARDTVFSAKVCLGNTKGGSITLPLTSCLTGLESAVRLLTIFVFICKTDQTKPVKQEVNSTVILPPFSIPWFVHGSSRACCERQ